MAAIHILRHGQARHNVERGYPFRDPPLTELGCQQATDVQQNLVVEPDLILVSPMTRTIQTALIVFGHLFDSSSANKKVEVQIWPDLREAHDAICNKGVARADLTAKFPQFDFSACHVEWDYPEHTPDIAVARAGSVRQRLKHLATSGGYKNIVLITHRGFIAYMVQGARFNPCDYRSYQFAQEDADERRQGVNIDTGIEQDYGPNLLLPRE
ncbi:hypothetical protein FZEAL_147 [Fusarium zealandicum]|uniref:Phosphoglycerate mutase n=1 Tax=Fusarium zealandicum TaxID=1053134 RepID=A0A8H4UV70_9HYPO|nr:hypothetical protein FZEAL_147 [Fusarium zealandicum]